MTQLSYVNGGYEATVGNQHIRIAAQEMQECEWHYQGDEDINSAEFWLDGYDDEDTRSTTGRVTVTIIDVGAQ